MDQPIYYVTDSYSLVETINTIKKSKKILFENVSFGGTYKENIYNLLNCFK